MIPDYVICTPITPAQGRKWTLPFYRRGIDSLDPQPEAVGLIATPEIYEEFFSDDPKYILVDYHPAVPKGKTTRIIGQNREILNEWFWNERTEDYIWWIDSDIEVFSDTYLNLIKIMQHENCMMFTNRIQARYENRYWSSIACTIVNREICKLGSFKVRDFIDDKGKINGVSEDLNYFSSYGNTIGTILLKYYKPSYDKVRVAGQGSYIKHHLDERANHPDFEYTVHNYYKKILETEEVT